MAKGVPQDYAEALKWYRLAADQGDASAQYNLGVMYAEGRGVPQDYAEALKWYRLAADQGYADAQFNLGVMYANGQACRRTTPRPRSGIASPLTKATPTRRTVSAVMYGNGHGVPQNYAEAVKWFRLAADQGDADTQYSLGLMYTKGEGVPQDYVRAHMWFNLSAAQGNQVAAGERDHFAKRMTPAQIAEAQKLAREWQPKRP